MKIKIEKQLNKIKNNLKNVDKKRNKTYYEYMNIYSYVYI